MVPQSECRMKVAQRPVPSLSRTLLLFIALAAGAFRTQLVLAQEAPPELEVASVKPSNPNEPVFGIRIQSGGDRFSITNATVKMLVGFAYRIPSSQIVGEPKWADSENFTIEAKVADGTKLSSGNDGYGQVMVMVQSLLMDRFRLSKHNETRTQDVYRLTVAKGGAKLKKADADENVDRQIGPGRLAGTMPLPVLATSLSQSLERPVVDKTGLAGNYTFKLTYAPDMAETPLTDSSLPSLFTALREQLGLDLKRAQEPVEVLVIDRVDRPSEN